MTAHQTRAPAPAGALFSARWQAWPQRAAVPGWPMPRMPVAGGAIACRGRRASGVLFARRSATMPAGRESGGIGRRPGFRFQCRKAWGFESPLSHHPCVGRMFPRRACPGAGWKRQPESAKLQGCGGIMSVGNRSSSTSYRGPGRHRWQESTCKLRSNPPATWNAA